MNFQYLRNPTALLLLVGLLLGIVVGYPLGSHTVTKTVTHTKVRTKNVSYQLAIGETDAQVANTLDLSNGKFLNAGTQKVGSSTFNCVAYYGHKDAKNVPTDWFDTFCAK